MTNIQFIAKQVATTPKNIEATVKLLNEDCTIPFISRYRKDTTGNLDEVFIEQIAKLNKEYENDDYNSIKCLFKELWSFLSKKMTIFDLNMILGKYKKIFQ